MTKSYVATIPARPRGSSAAVQEALKAFSSIPGLVTVKTSAPEGLEAAVDEIIAAAKAELSEETPVETVDPSTVFEFIPVKDKVGRYRLVSNALREFIDESLSVGCIEERMLETPQDTPEQKTARLKKSVISIDNILAHYGSFHGVDKDDIEASSSGLTYPQYQVFFNDLKTRYDGFMAQRAAEAEEKLNGHIEAFSRGVVTYADLEQGLIAESLYGKFKSRDQFMFGVQGQRIAGNILQVRRHDTMMGSYIEIRFYVYTHNGDGLSRVVCNTEIGGFEGTQTLEDLGVTRLVPGSHEFKSLVARGKRYVELTGAKRKYAMSNGNITRKYGRNVEISNAVGRVMVDITGMQDIDTNYYQYFCRDERDDDDEGSTMTRYYAGVKVTDQVLASCSPFVYGFSFKAKHWGQMLVDQISEIEFRDDVYDKLVLDQSTKDLIFAMVTDTDQGDTDLIAGKGAGSIILLEGPPGVGKTLTAEAVAEQLRAPMYYVTVGELGTDVNTLESGLKEILEIATAWGAIVLIDEGDIFLEARDSHDLVRNAMVAVFLRVLEYYPGILFLTTNRADNLDPAFESRISLCVHYNHLDYSSRKQIWTNLLASAKIKTIHATERLVGHVLNGRQIKHVIRTAGSIARYFKRDIQVEDFETVIRQKANFKASTVYKLGKGLNDDKTSVIDVEAKEVTPLKQSWSSRKWDKITGKQKYATWDSLLKDGKITAGGSDSGVNK
jgi:hypothetical protein